MYFELILHASFDSKKSIKTDYVLKVNPWSHGGQEVLDITNVGVNLLRIFCLFRKLYSILKVLSFCRLWSLVLLTSFQHIEYCLELSLEVDAAQDPVSLNLTWETYQAWISRGTNGLNTIRIEFQKDLLNISLFLNFRSFTSYTFHFITIKQDVDRYDRIFDNFYGPTIESYVIKPIQNSLYEFFYKGFY